MVAPLIGLAGVAAAAKSATPAFSNLARSVGQSVLPTLGLTTALSAMQGGMADAGRSSWGASAAMFQIETAMWEMRQAITLALLPAMEAITPAVVATARGVTKAIEEFSKDPQGIVQDATVAGGAAVGVKAAAGALGYGVAGPALAAAVAGNLPGPGVGARSQAQQLIFDGQTPSAAEYRALEPVLKDLTNVLLRLESRDSASDRDAYQRIINLDVRALDPQDFAAQFRELQSAGLLD